jgi:hypothetical protein
MTGPIKQKKLLGSQELGLIAKSMDSFARKQGVHSAVIGGFAMQLYGSPRLTSDLDFAAEQSLKRVKPVGHLTFGGDRLVGPKKVPVCWIVRNDEYAGLYQRALDYAVRSKRGFLVVRPEYLAAMKLAAGRPKDHEDLVHLLQQPGLVNLKRAREIVRTLVGGRFALDDFNSVVMEAQWRLRRDKR